MVKPVFKATKSKSTQASFSVEYPAGDVIFEEGSLGTEMYIVQQGKVAIEKRFKGTDHDFADFGDRRPLLDRTVAFFRKHMQAGTAENTQGT